MRKPAFSGLALLVLAVSAASTLGCQFITAATMAVTEIRGAHGTVRLVGHDESTTADLAAIRAIRFEPATSSAGPKMGSPRLIAKYDDAAREEADKKLREYYPGGSPEMSIASEILYFNEKGLFSGALCLTRVRGRSDEGRQILDAIIHAESKAFTAGGESALAEATVDALGDFLTKHRRKTDQ